MRRQEQAERALSKKKNRGGATELPMVKRGVAVDVVDVAVAEVVEAGVAVEVPEVTMAWQVIEDERPQPPWARAWMRE